MDELAVSESRKYRAVWSDKRYREVCPGERYLPGALDWLDPVSGASFTDWGCGTGRVGESLRSLGFDVRLVDIAENAYRGDLPFTQACLWDLPEELRPTEYGFCADVMEHIPTEHVDDVLDGISHRTLRKCYFQIALFHDLHFTQAGPLHLSVFPFEWWEERLGRHFSTVQFKKIKMKHVLAVGTK